VKLKVISIVTAFVFISCLFGCAAVSEEHKGAATGAGIGAATGAVAGALLGSKGAKTEMAILGGLAGALVGGAIGHYAYDTQRTREETAQTYQYQSSMGTMIRIEDVSTIPDTVKAGDRVDLNVTYAVLDTAPESNIDVVEIREIRFDGELVGRPEVTVTRRGGTYTSTVPVYLPSNAKAGKYRVLITVQSQTAKDSREMSFTVK
jgi:surface antigen